ncbi:MAG: hypothetical protein R3A45_02970 [Bdellovibrionota bacterium]
MSPSRSHYRLCDGSSDDDFDPLRRSTVTALVADDDSAGFTVTESGGSTSATEDTNTDSLRLLDAQPSSDVIDVSSSDTGAATVSSSVLIFTNANWDTSFATAQRKHLSVMRISPMKW